MQSQLVSAHGMLAIMEVLESRISREVALRLLQIVNAVKSLAFMDCFRNSSLIIVGHSRHGFPRKLLLDWVHIPFQRRCAILMIATAVSQ